MGETPPAPSAVLCSLTFSILERIDVGETIQVQSTYWTHWNLSVSSNGSTWVKLLYAAIMYKARATFSILERIDVGETLSRALAEVSGVLTFSILERIDVGETILHHLHQDFPGAFSILERIDVGETQILAGAAAAPMNNFQYPRTDRRG